MFYIEVSFGPQQITVECKLWFPLIIICSKSPLNHTRAALSTGMFFTCFCFLYVACMQPLSCGRDIFVAYEKRISWFPQADEQNRHMLRYTHTSINMRRYGTFYIQINVCIVVFLFRGRSQRVFRYVDAMCLLPLYVLKHCMYS